ncbi:MAG: hypothetical protein LBP92_10000 [Deltaproteobacteria bacterium]|jgi:hypothetical protein|nr:hypothetical protein [Deltaproteobacteria bacterium]
MDFKDYYRLLSEEPALVQALIAFNHLADPPEMGISFPVGLTETRLFFKMTAQPSLTPFFPRKNREGLWDFQDEPRRLALVEAETFHQMCLYWGAAVFADDLAGVIERDEAARLKAGLGPDLYQFVVGRGRFCLGSLRKFYRLENAEGAVHSASFLKQVGLLAASACAGDWPEELLKIAELRFQVKLAEAIDRPYPPGVAKATWPWLKRILLEVAPQWRPCFT